MALFRPYKHDPQRGEDGSEQPSTTPRLDAAAPPSGSAPAAVPMTPRNRKGGTAPGSGAAAVPMTPRRRKAAPAPAEPAPTPSPEQTAAERVRNAPKARPTPSRREAEAARRERLNPSISKKEARRRAAEANRRTRLAQMAARDNTPAKTLLRDHVDARFSLGQLLLPALLVIVMSTFLGSVFPRVVVFSTIAMYLFLALVIGDFVLMWRRYRRIAEERGIPLERGLKMYGMNRMIQIRRMRIPKPVVSRGDSY